MIGRRVSPVVILAIAIVAALPACGGNGKQAATGNVGFDTLTFYPLNNSAPNQPSGFYLATQEAVVTDGTEAFDIAFDLTADGLPIVYPIRLVTQALGAPHQVGLQLTSLYFDANGCPVGADTTTCWIHISTPHNYQFDSAYTLTVGQVLLIASQSPTCSGFNDPTLYGKLVFDSIHVATHQMFARTVVDPNCGYVSFEPGLPSQ
jgi:hypothetical protein